MIAHVAEAGEGRGRVLLRYMSGDASPLAIAAAVRIAQAFHSEIESLFIEDSQLFDLARHSFVRELSFDGRVSREITPRGIEASLRASFIAARRRILAAAVAAEVPLRERVVRDEPVHAIAAACAHNGPWNVIALAEAFSSTTGGSIGEIFDAVTDVTGLVLVGPRASRTSGPIIVAAEDLDRLPGMVRAAERLARLSEAPIVIVVLADSEIELDELDAQIRLMLGDRPDVRLAHAAAVRGEPAAAAEMIRRLSGGFLIARFGGTAAPREGGWRALVSALECPLFLIR
ncbi:MAG: hypothetical protein KDJ36_11695 [Hyphomicrobiaceae bacterium]|nr:hypothetical protein [Hyphomicrobiaceae bacterium]